MSSFFRRTRLYLQIQESCAEYRSLRRQQHRAALKMQRQLVRMQVLSELNRSRLSGLAAQMTVAESAARLAAAQNVLRAQRARREALEALASKAGATLPGARAGEGEEEKPEAFKARMAEAVRRAVPDGARGVAAGRMMDEMLEESVKEIELDGTSGREAMGVELAVQLARQGGVGEKELRRMLDSISDADAGGVNDYLRDRVLQRLKDTESADAATAAESKQP